MSRNKLLAGLAAVALIGTTWNSAAIASSISVGWAASSGSSFTQLSNGITVSGIVDGIGTDDALWNQTVTTTSGVKVTTAGFGKSAPFLSTPGVSNSNTQDTVNVSGGCPTCSGTLALIVTAYNMTYPPTGTTNWQTSFTANPTNTGTETDTMAVYVTEGAGDPGYTNLASLPAGDLIAGPSATSETVDTTEDLTDPFAISEVYIIKFTGNFNINDTISVVSTVPEPASLSLLGSGLLAFGAWQRRRRSKSQLSAS